MSKLLRFVVADPFTTAPAAKPLPPSRKVTVPVTGCVELTVAVKVTLTPAWVFTPDVVRVKVVGTATARRRRRFLRC